MVKYPVSKLNQKCASIVEDKLWTFRLFRASIHVGIQKLTFHACLFMHLAWEIIQLAGFVMTLDGTPGILEYFVYLTVKMTWKSHFLGVSVGVGVFNMIEPGIESVLVITLESILDSVQDLDLKKCGYFWRLSYTKLPHCRTVRLELNSHFVWNYIRKYEIAFEIRIFKNADSGFLKL